MSIELIVAEKMKVKVEMGGGLEDLFAQQKRFVIDVQEPEFTVSNLIGHMAKNHMEEHEDMFAEGQSVRPGIMVTINDADWELEGKG